MKKFNLILLSLISSFTLYAAEQQDIVIKSRFDRSSSAVIVERIRDYLVNNNIGDPYNQGIGDVSVEFLQVMDRLPPETQSWVRDLQEVLPLRIFDSEYRLVVEDLGYSITRFDTELRPSRSATERIEYVTLSNVYGLSLHAKNISFEVKLPEAEGEEPIVFEVTLVNPIFALNPELTTEIQMGWSTALMPGELFLALHTINLAKTFAALKDRPDLIAFSIKDMILPEVSIRIGNREIPFDHAKIKRFFKAKEEELKLGLLDLISTRMSDRLNNVIEENPMEVHLSRHFTTQGKLNGKFELRNIKVQDRSILKADVGGNFFNLEGNLILAPMRREVDDSTFDQSMVQMDNSLISKTGNIAVSVSEHFLNQIAQAAIDSGAVDLSNQGFTFGPEKLFVLAEKKGEALSLYLDIIYKLSGSRRVLVGRPELRFPVKLNIGLKIVETEADPRLQIKVLKVDTTDELLINGLKKYGLLSNVRSARFRKKVLSAIREDLSDFDGKLLVDLELKELRGTSLDRLNFSSDGLGRATAVLNLE